MTETLSSEVPGSPEKLWTQLQSAIKTLNWVIKLPDNIKAVGSNFVIYDPRNFWERWHWINKIKSIALIIESNGKIHTMDHAIDKDSVDARTMGFLWGSIENHKNYKGTVGNTHMFNNDNKEFITPELLGKLVAQINKLASDAKSTENANELARQARKRQVLWNTFEK